VLKALRNDIQSVLFSEEKLAGIVDRIGKQISEDYKDKNLLMVSVLKGSVVFMADLMRAITIPCSIDFMCVSSYGSGTKTSGVVKIIKDLDINLKGYDLLVVEDILDSGMTLSYILELLQSRSPRSVRLCTLFDKPDRRTANIKADYVGTVVPDEFIVGYGLDYDEKYRNLPFVGILKPEVYTKSK
jgi:hypoxanthine phosphoribosyltransferase